MCIMETGCASAALLPMYIAAFAFCMSLYELVIAPYPHVFATPATVVEWHIRAWWSQLLLPQRDIHFLSR